MRYQIEFVSSEMMNITITIKCFSFFLVGVFFILLSACSGDSGSIDNENNDPGPNKTSDPALENAEFALTLDDVQLFSGTSKIISVAANFENGNKATDLLDDIKCVLHSYTDRKVLLLNEDTCEVTGMFPGYANIDLQWRKDLKVNLSSTPLQIHVVPQVLGQLDGSGQYSTKLATLKDVIYTIYQIDGAITGKSYKVSIDANMSERLAMQTLIDRDGEYELSCLNSLPSGYARLACGVQPANDRFYVALADINGIGVTPLLENSVVTVVEDTDILLNEGSHQNRIELALGVEHLGHVSVNEVGNFESYYSVQLDSSADNKYEVILSGFDNPISMEVEYDGLVCSNDDLQLVNNMRRCVVPAHQNSISITINGNNAGPGESFFNSPAATQGEAEYKLLVQSIVP